MTTTDTTPWAVGVLRHVAGGPLVMPISEAEMERDAQWATGLLRRMGLGAGDLAHLIGPGGDYHLLWPFEDALTRMRVPFGQADTLYDAARTAMFLRRVRPQAVIGLTLEVLDALPSLGLDPVQAFQDVRIACGYAAAAEKLKSMGLSPWKQAMLGPFYGFEPPEGGGYSYNHEEWLVEEDAGRLRLSSRRPRMLAFDRLDLGIRGSLTEVTGESRIVLEE